MIGSVLGERYEIRDEIGRGGMGVVYRAHDPVLDREVAVKIVPPTLLDDRSRERMRREARIVAALDHPGIVPVHDMGEADGEIFVVMPILEGITLRERIDREPLSHAEAVDVGFQVARALAYSHAHSVLHRDLKPENLMVQEEHGELRVRVMDFGLALNAVDPRLTHAGTLVGTFTYLSPEQVAEKPIDGRADLYSLAVVLYECLTGEPPFTGDAHSLLYRIAFDPPQSLRERGVRISPELDALILRCLAKEPDERPEDAAALAREMGALRRAPTNGSTRPATHVVARPRSARPAGGADIPFTGRERELEQLERHLQRALEGTCQLVLIAGEAGVGKRRILRELEIRVESHDLQALHGRFVEQSHGLPFFGFCEVIQEWFKRHDAESAEVDLEDLAPELLRHFPSLSEIEALRRASGEVPNPTRSVSPGLTAAESDRTVLFELLARTLRRLGQHAPMVLVLQDLHDADVSLEALQYLVRRLASTPTLIVGSYQPQSTPRGHPLHRLVDAYLGDPQFGMIELRPFSREEHKSFVQRLLGGREPTPELAGHLFDASDGNAFFTRELVRSLVENAGIVQEGSGSWRFSAERRLAANALPDTIHQAVQKRIDALDEGSRSVLAVASVLGRAFDFRDLEHLLDDFGELDESVDRLVELGLLEEISGSTVDRLAFTSGVICDVVHASLTRRRRRSLHRRHADHLEKRNEKRLHRVYPQLLHHYGNADVPAKVLDYGPLTAQIALDSFRPEEALRAAQTVLEFLDDERCVVDPALEGEVRLLMAEAWGMAQDTDAALKQSDLAVRCARRCGCDELVIQAMMLAAETAWAGRRMDAATHWVEEALAAASPADDAVLYRKLLSLAATLANLRGAYETGLHYLEQARALDPSTAADEAPPSGGTLVVALPHAPRGLAPVDALLVEDQEVMATIHETLVVTDGCGNLVPHLCRRWESRSGGRIFRLHLRRDVRFHDGTLMDAAAVKASFELAIARRDASSIPAFAPIKGVGDDAPAIRILDEHLLEVELERALPIFPALLTGPQTMIVRSVPAEPPVPDRLVGTGPFRMKFHGVGEILLERNEDYWGEPPHLDAIEFRTGIDADEAARGFAEGDLDLVHSLKPADLNRLRRDPALHARFVESPLESTDFMLLNPAGPVTRDPDIRRAIVGSLKVHDLVWRTLGRAVHPASCLIPPGVLGHDPGRRHPFLGIDGARSLLGDKSLKTPLRVAVHPSFMATYAPLFEGLLEVLRETGIEAEVVTSDLAGFEDRWENNGDIDLFLTRWVAEYRDPDDFTYSLFHGRHGLLRAWYHDDDLDKLALEARLETHPDQRIQLYEQYEDHLRDAFVCVPLFHETAWRLAGPKVHQVSLEGRAPFVDYAGVAVGEPRVVSANLAARRSGLIRIPQIVAPRDLDPATVRPEESFAARPPIFETLTRISDAAQVVPWLARSWTVSDDARLVRILLRDDVQFHDGRRLTSRDVRWSFERLLLQGGANARLLDVVSGAEALRDGAARELAGCRLVSATELHLVLTRPLPILPFLLSHPACGIVPEGAAPDEASAPVELVGTGPFRPISGSLDGRLELAAFAGYWRPMRPRAEGLVFDYGIPRERLREEVEEAPASLITDLSPEDRRDLRFHPGLGGGYLEVPCVATTFLALNAVRGPLADPLLRQRVVDSLAIGAVIRETMAGQVSAAKSLFPPGLVQLPTGNAPSRWRGGAPQAGERDGRIELKAAVLQLPGDPYVVVLRALLAGIDGELFDLRVLDPEGREFEQVVREDAPDLVLARVVADYPDPDSLAHPLFDGRRGLLRDLHGLDSLPELVEAARGETDASRRQNYYRDLDQTLWRDALLVPLFHEPAWSLAGRDVAAPEPGLARPFVPFADLRLRS